MIFNIFTYKDKRIGVYANPMIRQEGPAQIGVMIERSILSYKEEDKEAKENLLALVGRELHHLGSFDDEAGTITVNEGKTLILDCDTCFAKRKLLDEKEKGV